MNLLYQIKFRCRHCGTERRITIPDDWQAHAVLYKLSNLENASCPDCGGTQDPWIFIGVKRMVTNKHDARN